VKRVLFICEGNVHRSRTAEALYASAPGIQARSAGLSHLAKVQVTEELLAWADTIFVMQRRLVKMLRQRFDAVLLGKEVVCLRVPDDYQFLQPELLTILVERLTPYLGPVNLDANRSSDEGKRYDDAERHSTD
jgi:predicted protein tyrosine phosphatase